MLAAAPLGLVQPAALSSGGRAVQRERTLVLAEQAIAVEPSPSGANDDGCSEATDEQSEPVYRV